jgi:hypothetical protein
MPTEPKPRPRPSKRKTTESIQLAIKVNYRLLFLESASSSAKSPALFLSFPIRTRFFFGRGTLGDVASFDARLSLFRLSGLGLSFFRRCSSLIFSLRWTSAEISSVPSDVDVTSPSSCSDGCETSRCRFEARGSSIDASWGVISGSGCVVSLSRELRRLFLRVFASVSVGGLWGVDLEEELEEVFSKSLSASYVCLLWEGGCVAGSNFWFEAVGDSLFICKEDC